MSIFSNHPILQSIIALSPFWGDSDEADDGFKRIVGNIWKAVKTEMDEVSSEEEFLEYCESMMGLIEDAENVTKPSHRAVKSEFQKLIDYRERKLKEFENDTWCYFIESGRNEFFCLLDDEEIGWSKHIIDAVMFYTEEEAEAKREELGLIFCGVAARSGPPQAFLYTNPHLQPKEERIRKHSESLYEYAHRLGLAWP